MSLTQHARQSFSLAVITVCCAWWSPSLFAADIDAQVGIIDSEPTIESLSFSRDLRLMQSGDTLDIAVEPPLSLSIIENIQRADGSHSIEAKASNGARLLMSIDDKAHYGSILGAGLNYSISTDNAFGTILVNQAHPEFPREDFDNDAMVPPTKRADLPGIMQMSDSQKSKLAQLNTRKNGSSNITILFVYSREFGQGFASPQTRINDLLSYTNQSLSDSGINITFTLAAARQINFDNSSSTSGLLNQVTRGEGAFSEVANLRNEVGADMVAVLSFAPGSSANGVAWVNGDDPNFAFSSTRLSPRCCNSVFAHELGHNLGSGHERDSVNDTGDPCSSFNFTGYSCGHGNASRNWGTMMSRLDRRAVGNVFSNPSNQCLGEPCGIPEGQAGAADNARSFNIARLLVADFRDDPIPSGPTNPRSRTTGANGLPAIISILVDEE